MYFDTIRQLRTKNCLTQEQLAWKTGLSQSFIARIENGDKKPSIESLVKIAKALNVGVSELLLEMEDIASETNKTDKSLS